MTIASEITRLQNAKTCICAAIEDKGVTVGSISIDQYAACIAAIPTGPIVPMVDFLLVGGGGGADNSYVSGGGGGGGVIHCSGMPISSGNYNITIGEGGCSGKHLEGCNSCFDSYIAYGGGFGNNGNATCGASGGGTSCYNIGKAIHGSQGHDGAKNVGNYWSAGGGGGGAGGAGCTTNGCFCGGNGGPGYCSDISGAMVSYGGGGAGAGQQGGGIGGGGGRATCVNGHCATRPTCCGGGANAGDDSSYKAVGGANGVFILRYPTDCGYSIGGGTKYTCGIYTIHCFTSDGVLAVG